MAEVRCNNLECKYYDGCCTHPSGPWLSGGNEGIFWCNSFESTGGKEVLSKITTKEIAELDARIGKIERILSATREIHWLDGLRVQCISDGETGTVEKIWLNRNQQLVQIVVKMDSWGNRCFLPHQLSIHKSSFHKDFRLEK
jgi:hypothetical protein